jgi:hypothetical protein
VTDYSGPNLRLYDSVLDTMLNSKAGDMGKYMRRIGTEIVAGAKVMAPVRTGHLKRSISLWRHERWVRGQLIEVGSPLSYAHLVHEGSRPHLITSHTGRTLAFKDHGRMVFAKSVIHPGFRGRKYLTEPMARAVRR